MITIKEIAELAGVSIGTVDRVIHDRGRVSTATKDKILAIMEARGYRKNIVASQLSNSRIARLAVILPHPRQNDCFWEQVRTGIDEAVGKLGFLKLTHSYYYFNRYDTASYISSFEEALSSEPDGILLPPILADETVKFKSKITPGTMVVFFNSDLPDFPRRAAVGQDSFDGGRTAGRLMELLTGGKGDIAVIEVEPEDFHINTRASGFKHHLMKNGHMQLHSFLLPPENRPKEIEETAGRIAEEIRDLAGLFVPNSSVHFFADLLPDEVKVIGYDLVEANASMLKKGKIDFLINQQPEKQGELAMEKLIKCTVLKEDIVEITTLPIEIICRENLQSYK